MTAYEKETYYHYTAEGPNATLTTFDARLIAQFKALAAERAEKNDVKMLVCRESDDGVYAEFSFPKKWLKVRPPRILSDEERAALVERGKALFAMRQKTLGKTEEEEEEIADKK